MNPDLRPHSGIQRPKRLQLRLPGPLTRGSAPGPTGGSAARPPLYVAHTTYGYFRATEQRDEQLCDLPANAARRGK